MNNDIFNPAEIARSIMDSTTFLSLATSNGKETWIAPLFFVHDRYKTIYFVSSIDSLHVQHIQVRSQVALSIFNMNQKEGNLAADTNGVQIRGRAIFADKSEYEKVMELFNQKIWPDESKPIDVDKYEGTGRSIFKIYLDEIYVQDPEYFQKHHEDKRIKVDL